MNPGSNLTANRPKTLEEHREYLFEIVRLMLFFTHLQLSEHPEESFRFVIRNRVDIYRKTDANPGPLNPAELHMDEPPWLDMECQAEQCWQAHKEDRAAFEAEAFEIFRPSIERRVVRDFHDDSVLKRYQCGCFRHNLQLNSPEDRCLGFHIANDKTPDSLFDHPDHVRACLLKLCDIAEKDFGAVRLGTFTWLNSYRRFLDFFPPEWSQNMGEENHNVGWGYGHWGQFISARGTYNRRHGDYLRQTGKMPFYPKRSSCRISVLRQFLHGEGPWS